MTVIEFTGKDFKAYRDYLNNLQDHWGDHTALIGLKDIEKTMRWSMHFSTARLQASSLSTTRTSASSWTRYLGSHY